MKPSWIQRITQSRYLWSALGGLLLGASFPKPGLAGLAWVGPGCILFAALGRGGGESLRIGYVGGLAYSLWAFSWLLHIPFPPGAIAGWVALSAYMALFPAAWVWLSWWLHSRFAGPPPEGSMGVGQFLELNPVGRVAWSVACAALWVALEMTLARLFTGCPWNLLGASQYQILPLIQIAQVTGVYGVSFLVVWFSVALGSACLNLASHPTQSKAWLGDLVLPLIALLVTIACGSSELAGMKPTERTLKAVLIQPSIPQTLIWDTNQNALRFQQLVDLSARALRETTNARLLVWPEAAVPNMLRYDYGTYSAVTNLTFSNQVWAVLGSDDAAPHPGGTESEVDYFNTSFLVAPSGEIVAAYRKRQLVIFGEYIPLERWLPFMKYLTPVGGSFAAGREPMSFYLPGIQAKASILICFEDIFPHVAREGVKADTDFLLNLTNNGWFGESAAQWQHAANAVFRAVENRRPLVRCTNNGLTCWVDMYGGMHDVYFPNSRNIYEAGFKAVDIPLLPRGTPKPLTFYGRHGDWFGWACVGVSIVLLGGQWVARRHEQRLVAK